MWIARLVAASLVLLVLGASPAQSANYVLLFNNNHFINVNADPSGVCSAVIDGRGPKTSGTNWNNYCVALGVATTKPKDRVPVYLSIVNTETNTPAAVAFALPVAESPAARGAVNTNKGGRNTYVADDFNLGWARPAWPAFGAVAEAPFTYSPDSGRDFVKVNNQYVRAGVAIPGAAPPAVAPTTAPNTIAATTDGARGHMCPNAAFTPQFVAGKDGFAGNQEMSEATFLTGVNTFPSFNNAPDSWDGRMWNHREEALKSYAIAVGGTHTVKIVVGTGGEPLYYLRSDNPALAAANPQTRANLINVPSLVWTAVYDTANKRGIAWKCTLAKDCTVATNSKPLCSYVTINDIKDEFSIDPFPNVEKENAIRTNKDPAAFAAVAGTWSTIDGKDNNLLWW